MIDFGTLQSMRHAAGDACLQSGLTPVQWRFSFKAWHLFKQGMAPYMAAGSSKITPPPAMPPGCLGVLDGLPVYLMCPVNAPNVQVACIGAKLPVPPLF